MGAAASARPRRYRRAPSSFPSVSSFYAGEEGLLARGGASVIGGGASSRAAGMRVQRSSQGKGVAPRRTGGRLFEAQRAVQSVLRSEVAECSRLWQQFENELSLTVTIWESAGGSGASREAAQARGLLRAAVAVGDTTQLGMALQHAAKHGMPLGAVGLHEALDQLLAKEDSEGTWRCLASALAEKDCFALAFWLEQAQEKGLEVPNEVLKHWLEEDWPHDQQGLDRIVIDGNYQEVLDAHVIEAHARKDREELGRLVAQARRLGWDTGLAQAALDSLGPVGRMGSVASSVSSSSIAAAASPRDLDPELDSLRHWGAGALKTELQRLGVDLGAVCEKEELVQLLHDLRRTGEYPPRKSTKMGSSRTRQSGNRSTGVSSPREHAAEPTHVPNRGLNPNSPSFSDPPSARGAAYKPDGRRPTAPHPDSSARARAQNDPQCERQQETRRQHQDRGEAGRGGCGIGEQDRATGRDHYHDEQRSRSKQKRENARESQDPRDTPPPPRSAATTEQADLIKALVCLGLPETSSPTPEELRLAYKQAALRWHPDRRQNHECAEEAKQRFQEARAAFELLQGRCK